MRALIKLFVSGGIITALVLFAISSYRQFTVTGEVDPHDSVIDVADAAIQTREAIYSGIRETRDLVAPVAVNAVEEPENHDPLDDRTVPTLSEVLSLDSLWIEDADTDPSDEADSLGCPPRKHLSGEQLDEVLALIIEADKLLEGNHGN